VPRRSTANRRGILHRLESSRPDRNILVVLIWVLFASLPLPSDQCDIGEISQDQFDSADTEINVMTECGGIFGHYYPCCTSK